MNGNKNGSNGAITWKQVVALGGVLAAIATIHAVVVMPMIAAEVTRQIQTDLGAVRSETADRIKQVRSDTVSRREFDMILQRLDSIDRKLERK